VTVGVEITCCDETTIASDDGGTIG